MKNEQQRARRVGAQVIRHFALCSLHFALCILFTSPLAASDIDEFRIKRADVFEFAEKPSTSRDRDNVTIRFAAKAACDVTVAIEEAGGPLAGSGQGRIVRHLGSGVLGPKAPEPFQKDSLAQAIVWDGKDDQGRRVDNWSALAVRVSLGLKPQFERTLFWSPKRRQGREAPIACPAPEGVYVYDGGEGVERVALFDHDGQYVRTVYPFPANKVKDVRGLMWHTFPHDGRRLPIKGNFLQNTLLTCGTNAYNLMMFKPGEDRFNSTTALDYHYGQEGNSVWSMAVRGNRMALAHVLVNRLATDGSSGGMNFAGPMIGRSTVSRGGYERGQTINISPRSVALSPDGKTLYATGYVFSHLGKASADIVTNQSWDCFNAVYAVSMDNDEPLKVFAGVDKNGDSGGTGDGQFRIPASVAVDAAGKVYVADYMNDRIQVFSPDGKLLAKIPANRPAQIAIDDKAGVILVFSFIIYNNFLWDRPEQSIPPTLTRLGPLDQPKKIASYPLPTDCPARIQGGYYGTGMPMRAALDTFADPPTLWITESYVRENVLTRRREHDANIRLLTLRDGQFKPKHQFNDDVEKSLDRTDSLRALRQRLYVNPANGRLYVAEGDSFLYKAFKQLVEIDPATGSHKTIELPFDAEDMCFDAAGQAYLRSISVVARYDPNTWREVPWDYGEERAKVFTSSSGDRREAEAVSGLALPADGGWHHGGMHVAANGNLAVVCLSNIEVPDRRETPTANVGEGKKYTPVMWPGRVTEGRGGGVFIHVWDKHGRLIYEDVLPGLADNTYGVGLDSKDAVYMLAAATRVLDGKLYYNDMTGTMIKVLPKTARIVSTSDRAKLPLPKEEFLKRPFDLQNAGQGSAWAEGVQWMYGGVGWCGKNRGIGCACWNGRFTLDGFARSFAPEIDRYSVTVLDSGGNVITRIGQYGNVDDGKPLVSDGGPVKPQAVGGDEVALVHGNFLATETDRRLFISDPGNGRILSVKLDYHTTERVALK